MRRSFWVLLAGTVLALDSAGAASDGIAYPTLPKPAAFFCTDQTCSAPVFAVDDLVAKSSKR